MKVRRIFCPATVVLAVTLEPPGVIGPVKSVASFSFTLTEPVAAPPGSTSSVYVPSTERLGTSANVLPD